MSPRRPGQQGPNPMSPRAPRRNGTFGGNGPGKRSSHGGQPAGGRKVNTSGGGSWGGGGTKKGGCAVLILGALAATAGLGELARWVA